MRIPISWDKLWMDMAYKLSERSKDDATQVGCIIINSDNRIISYGYNGFAEGIEDTEDRWKRPEKYKRVIHAEENAVLNPTIVIKPGKPLFQCRMYITVLPCSKCARIVIQSGVKEVIYKNERGDKNSLLEYSLTQEMFKEANVVLRKYNKEA